MLHLHTFQLTTFFMRSSPASTLSVAHAPPPVVRQLGLAEYSHTYAQMQAFTAARDRATQDEIWVVEHLPVFTLGLGADRAHLLVPDAIGQQQIPIIQTDRGGEVTYHGPGQVVVYLLLDLRRHQPAGRFFVRELVNRIEQAIINVLASYQLKGERKPGAPGIYLAANESNLLQNHTNFTNFTNPSNLAAWQGAKIAALGLKVRGTGCTYHGLSLNVAMDLQPFSWINPCGYAGLATVDMQTLGVLAPMHEVQQALVQQLCGLLFSNVASLAPELNTTSAQIFPHQSIPFKQVIS
jgi:lipoyl(octanoyl) transferase